MTTFTITYQTDIHPLWVNIFYMIFSPLPEVVSPSKSALDGWPYFTFRKGRLLERANQMLIVLIMFGIFVTISLFVFWDKRAIDSTLMLLYHLEWWQQL